MAFEDLALEDALTSVVLPYLKGVGDRWEAGTIGVGQEHLASNVIRSRLSSVMHTQAREHGPLAVLACMPKGHHEFGLTAAALALSQLGWRTCYLGANTPIAELVRACGRLQPDAVLLSAHRPTAYAAHAPVCGISPRARRSTSEPGGRARPSRPCATRLTWTWTQLLQHISSSAGWTSASRRPQPGERDRDRRHTVPARREKAPERDAAAETFFTPP